MPSFERKYSNCPLGSGLVSMSASIYFVLQYLTNKDPNITCSRTKWYLISICFVRLCPIGFHVSPIAAWLSSHTVTGLVQLTPMSVSSCRNQTTSCVAELKAMYSASAVERATVDCFWLSQLIAPLDILKTLPVVERRVSKSQAQSASLYPSTSGSQLSVHLYWSDRLSVPLR